MMFVNSDLGFAGYSMKITGRHEMSDLELGVVGNCSFAAFIDRNALVVWCCMPRFDGDPVFHCLLGAPNYAEGWGLFAIELEDTRKANNVMMAIPRFLRRHFMENMARCA